MLKLVRNTVAEKGMLIDNNNQKILWQYIVGLHNLQHNEGPRVVNKLELACIQSRE